MRVCQLWRTLIETCRIMARKTNTGIPGLSFSWKRALGITQAKQKFSRETGIPTSKSGLERKIGKSILKVLWNRWDGSAVQESLGRFCGTDSAELKGNGVEP